MTADDGILVMAGGLHVPLPNMSLGHHMKVKGWPRLHKVFDFVFILHGIYYSSSQQVRCNHRRRPVGETWSADQQDWVGKSSLFNFVG